MFRPTRKPGWNWLLQRVTALLLVVGLVGHFLVLHFTRLYNSGSLKAAESTASRFLASPKFWLVFDGMLLTAGIYHALHGLYTIFTDANPSPKLKRVTGAALWTLGLAMLVVGLVLLARFLPYAVGR